MHGRRLPFIDVLVHYRVQRSDYAPVGKSRASHASTAWTTFIPANFLVGIISVWVYTRMSPDYGSGTRAAVRAAVAVWVVFWVIPEMALLPLKLFPSSLLFTVIAAGLLDTIPAVLLGAWIYRR